MDRVLGYENSDILERGLGVVLEWRIAEDGRLLLREAGIAFRDELKEEVRERTCEGEVDVELEEE